MLAWGMRSATAMPAWAASGEYVGGGLRPDDVLDPPVEGRCVVARLDAGAVVLRERDPSPRDQPLQRFPEALELALAEALELAVPEALELALADAAIDELLRE